MATKPSIPDAKAIKSKNRKHTEKGKIKIVADPILQEDFETEDEDIYETEEGEYLEEGKENDPLDLIVNLIESTGLLGQSIEATETIEHGENVIALVIETADGIKIRMGTLYRNDYYNVERIADLFADATEIMQILMEAVDNSDASTPGDLSLEKRRRMLAGLMLLDVIDEEQQRQNLSPDSDEGKNIYLMFKPILDVLYGTVGEEQVDEYSIAYLDRIENSEKESADGG